MMLPSSFLNPGSQGPQEVPPPHGFKPLKSPIREVCFAISTNFTRGQGNTVAREDGCRYEAQVHTHLRKLLGAGYVAVEFDVTDASGRRRLIPDGVFFHLNHLLLVEVKRQHMPEAWWQLRKLYQPALEFKVPQKKVSVLEVVKSYDPAMPFPEAIELVSDLGEWAKRPQTAFGVYIWKQG